MVPVDHGCNTNRTHVNHSNSRFTLIGISFVKRDRRFVIEVSGSPCPASVTHFFSDIPFQLVDVLAWRNDEERPSRPIGFLQVAAATRCWLEMGS